MATYKELLAQQKMLEEQIKAAHAQESSGAVSQVRQIVAEFGLVESDVFGASSPRGPKTSKTPVAPKYQDPASGKTWTGRGKSPLWLAGKDRDTFLIK